MDGQTQPDASGGPPGADRDEWRRRYWKKNLRLMIILLVIWFTVSFGFGILLIEPMNNIVILGFPLGLWFAQQGSILTFMILILVYAVMMDRIDDEFGVAERGGDGERR